MRRATKTTPSRCGCGLGRPRIHCWISPQRLDWWRTRWRHELVPATKIVIAEDAGEMIGFVTVDPRTLYLDQIVVAPALGFRRRRSTIG